MIQPYVSNIKKNYLCMQNNVYSSLFLKTLKKKFKKDMTQVLSY